jgi:hypothetical protein
MAQFSVPQFIDIESKIVGPLTIRQFAIIAVPALLAFALFFVLNIFFWVPIAVVLVSLAVSFAFVKIGGRPLYKIAVYALKFFWQPKLYLWKPAVVTEKIVIPEIERKRFELKTLIPDFSKVNKLWQDMTTTKNPIPKREKILPQNTLGEIKEQYQVFRKLSGEREIAKRVDFR